MPSIKYLGYELYAGSTFMTTQMFWKQYDAQKVKNNGHGHADANL